MDDALSQRLRHTPSGPDAGRWDIFCHVIDHYGDAALCWRLARQLAQEYGLRPRLWIDDLPTLAALVPNAQTGTCIEGVIIEHWHPAEARLNQTTPHDVAPVVIAALGCTLPAGYRNAMRLRRPLWINLEHLSAEDWVAGCHGLASPKPDGLTEYFFFPGFTEQTGGLFREAHGLAQRRAFLADPRQAHTFLSALGVPQKPSTHYASLFCYSDSDIVTLLEVFAAQPEPWQLLVPSRDPPDGPHHPHMRFIPFVRQTDYDRLLWCCALNFVRGEDSFIRGLWAGQPIVWQAYRQPDAAHHAKVRAFTARWAQDATPEPTAARAWNSLMAAWNGLPQPSGTSLGSALQATLAELPALQAASTRWVAQQSRHPDLTQQLVTWIAARL
jgi:uncharacterized repeat protein (TIGR03837 family)